MIFSHVLYQLSYLGPRIGRAGEADSPLQAPRSLTLALFAVQPEGVGFIVRDGARDAIAFAEPLQEVARLAAVRAERRKFLARRLSADGAGFSCGRSGHESPNW